MGIVSSFLASGDNVATCARSSTEAVEAWQSDPATADRFLFEPVDLSDRSSASAFVTAVIERFDKIDVLVNNAGVARDGILGLFE